MNPKSLRFFPANFAVKSILLQNELYENYCDRPQYSLFNISNLIASVETCHDARNSHIIDLPELDQFVHNNGIIYFFFD